MIFVGWVEERNPTSVLGFTPFNPTYEESYQPIKINVVKY